MNIRYNISSCFETCSFFTINFIKDEDEIIMGRGTGDRVGVIRSLLFSLSLESNDHYAKAYG